MLSIFPISFDSTVKTEFIPSVVPLVNIISFYEDALINYFTKDLVSSNSSVAFSAKE